MVPWEVPFRSLCSDSHCPKFPKPESIGTEVLGDGRPSRPLSLCQDHNSTIREPSTDATANAQIPQIQYTSRQNTLGFYLMLDGIHFFLFIMSMSSSIGISSLQTATLKLMVPGSFPATGQQFNRRKLDKPLPPCRSCLCKGLKSSTLWEPCRGPLKKKKAFCNPAG